MADRLGRSGHRAGARPPASRRRFPPAAPRDGLGGRVERGRPPQRSARPPGRPGGGGMKRVWAWLRILGAFGILAVLVWQLGTRAILDGLSEVDGVGILAALGIGFVTTVLAAGRWCVVATRLGLRLSLRGAIADYYRALFLNGVLPAGVLGDVHRAVEHGRSSGDVPRGVRSVVLERPVGQLIPVMILALLAMGLPLNVGGFGPREGVCALLFGTAGLGAAQGLTVAVVYGVLTLVSSTPGAGILLWRFVATFRTVRAKPGVVPAPRKAGDARKIQSEVAADVVSGHR